LGVVKDMCGVCDGDNSSCRHSSVESTNAGSLGLLLSLVAVVVVIGMIGCVWGNKKASHRIKKNRKRETLDDASIFSTSEHSFE
jgi:hypothetical protein